jgi:ribosomal protein S14
MRSCDSDDPQPRKTRWIRTDSFCKACGDPAKYQHDGKDLCRECFLEIARGKVEIMNVSFFGGRGGGMDDGLSPWGENALRAMEGD